MANIPSHMRLQGDFIALRRPPRTTSNTMLIALGSMIGLAAAAGALMGGLIH
ncbi:MAG TPA: hypothetical protein VHY32_08885 [Caulobacteraceae bacterium]|jgi:hypothetical protein|nr:hypothetical protein [Caulobacteraceae bacterium]